MYSKEELQLKYEQAVNLGLSGAALLKDPRAQRACNGIGAEWRWDNLRKLIGKFNPTLTLAADIQDMRYEIGGDGVAREFADDEFLANALVCADAKYCWLNPLRYHVRKQARKFHLILRVAGGKAWAATRKKKGGGE